MCAHLPPCAMRMGERLWPRRCLRKADTAGTHSCERASGSKPSAQRMTMQRPQLQPVLVACAI